MIGVGGAFITTAGGTVLFIAPPAAIAGGLMPPTVPGPDL